MNTQIIIFIGILVCLAAIHFLKERIFGQKSKIHENSLNDTGKIEVQNDKLILVDNITNTEIENIIVEFCEMYNSETTQVILRTYQLSGNRFAITFPYDSDFTIYCFLVNYICYPKGFDKTFDVTGWTTARKGDPWINGNIEGKKIMLYIPSDDDEYDNVYLTTLDGIGYKCNFALEEESELLYAPKKSFATSTINIDELTNKEQKEYK